jgi:glycosyltransferase involved in cell wall biosynthesis
MKISVFLDRFRPSHEDRDPGQIPLGLLEIGTRADVITVSKIDLANYTPEFCLIQKTLNELETEQFWSKCDSDVILAYTWLSPPYTSLVEKMKLGGKKILIKSDSNGRVEYPFQPDYLRAPLLERLTIRDIVRNIWERLPFKFLHSKSTTQIIKQIELSDGVIVESPDALSNLNYFLTTWGRQDLIKKTYFVPDPVTPDFIDAEIGTKENIVVSYGRWDDFRQKNTAVMVETIVKFLEERPDYTSIIFGTGKGMIQNLTKNIFKDIADRMRVLGFVERDRIKQILSSARMFFIPSRWESFGLAAGESLCMGCSVVATPVESLRYLTMQGFSGTVSSTFSKNAPLAALIQDSTKWENGYYEPDKIATFWRAKLNRKSVAKSIDSLASGRVKQLGRP